MEVLQEIKTLKIEIPYDLEILFMGVYLKERSYIIKEISPDPHVYCSITYNTQHIETSVPGFYIYIYLHWQLSCKESASNTGDTGLIPQLGKSPGRGHGNPCQYSCLENPMDRGAWWATVHRIAKRRTPSK